ncbi:MAG TPA: hypothetical protein DCS43_03120 [Verrucomicrobia bacterium]|nr:hypothetical protein [Verrucomicrobiota bacterium]
MYIDYWRLNCMPFENVSDYRFFFESEDHREAATRVQFAIQTRKLMMLLIGDYGVGKTMVCETVQHKLPTNEYKVVFIRNPRMDGLDLTREIAYQLGEEVHTRSPYDALHAVNNLLQRHASTGRHSVVFVDEAQLIMNTSTLEDLRLLLNNQEGGRSLMTLVLSGQSEIGDMLKAKPQIMQRIALKYNIMGLSAGDVRPYIEHRIQVAGGTGNLFDESAMQEIASLSKGNPREVNSLCDLCLLIGSLKQASSITVPIVRDAWMERA